MDPNHISDQLSRLQAADLIRRGQVDRELEYWFKHVLVQETAYESLLKATRADLHGRVAGAIEQVAAGRADERAAVLALHYDRAGLTEKAFRYAVLAGQNAWRGYAHEEALGYFDRALELSRQLDEAPVAAQVQMVFEGRGSVFEVAGQHQAAEANYREMAIFAERVGDLAMQVDALNRLVTVQTVYAGGVDLAANQQRALALAQQVGDPIRMGRALWNLGLGARFHDPQRAVEYFEQAAELARSSDAPGARDLVAAVQLDLMVGMAVMGRFRDGLAYARQAEEAFRQQGNRPMLADALGGAALMHNARGEVAEAHAKASEGLRISQELDNPWGVLYNKWTLAVIEVDRGNFEGALAMVEQHLAHAASLGFAVFEGQMLLVVAQACLELGQWSRALDLAERSHAAFERAGGPVWTLYGAGFYGQALLASGDVAGAGAVLEPLWREGEDARGLMEGFFTAGPTIAEWALRAGRLEYGLRFCDWLVAFFEPQGAARLLGPLRFFRGCMLRRRASMTAGGGASRAAEDLAAEHELTLARELLAQAEVSVVLWRVDAELAALYAERGDPEKAADHHRRAVELVQRLAAGIQDPALRASFLARPDVQRVLA